MHYEAAQFTNAVKSFYQMMDNWDKDLTAFEEIIKQKKEEGTPTAGMEINLMKGHQRYTEAFTLSEAAVTYITAMQAQIDKEHKNSVELRILQNKIYEIERRYRVKFHEM